MEVSGSDGRVLKRFELADIISDAMIAGGDDPRQFVYSAPTDWFHNNGATYNRADDSLIISSRENFVIALDYKTSRIKWILGDKTKKRVPISVSEKICDQSGTWKPAAAWATCPLHYIRSTLTGS